MLITDLPPMSYHSLSQIEIMHRFKEVGFTQEQAETQAQIITEVQESTLATKKDVKDLEGKTNAEFSLLRQEIKSEFTLVRMEFKKDIESLKNDLTSRIALMMTIAVGAVTLFQKIL